METYHIVILILLVQVILDGLGDGFRQNGWQNVHHSMETIREGIWLVYVGCVAFQWLDFAPYYITMYILGRIWLFDIVINLVVGNKLFYIGKSSLDGIILHKVADKFKVPVHLPAFIVKLVAIVWWIAWILTDGGVK